MPYQWLPTIAGGLGQGSAFVYLTTGLLYKVLIICNTLNLSVSFLFKEIWAKL